MWPGPDAGVDPDLGSGRVTLVRAAEGLAPLCLPWARRRLGLSATVCQHLRRISPRQIDRRLGPRKRHLQTRRYGRTKPGTPLKHHIPHKLDHWDVAVSGFT